MKTLLRNLFSGASTPGPKEIENLRECFHDIMQAKLNIRRSVAEAQDKQEDKGIDTEIDLGFDLDAIITNTFRNSKRTDFMTEEDLEAFDTAQDILLHESDKPIGFTLCVKDFSQKSSPFQPAMNFIKDNQDLLQHVAKRLQAYEQHALPARLHQGGAPPATNNLET
ncbi:MAG: hypothetical protein CMH27_05775 [Micavibrio sp.]|nr:hypothetical protein [Micavibrio sp.]|tara:strand:+ start:676 stop:1176 length:501 start_codon:yes stop_codon:yes gene_type:complete